MAHSIEIVNGVIALEALGYSFRKIAKEILGSESKSSTVSDIILRHRGGMVPVSDDTPETAVLKGKHYTPVNEDVIVIADTQVDPTTPVEHLHSLAEYIAVHQPKHIVHIGDHWDLPSLSSYASGLEQEGRRLYDDLEAGFSAFKIIMSKCPADYKPEKHFLMGNHECLKDTTEVLTDSGWKNIREVDTTDRVYTLNQDLTGVWQHPTSLINKKYSGDMYEFASSIFHVDCTENHRMYRVSRGGNLVVNLAKDVPKTLRLPVAALHVVEGVDRSEAEIRLGAWMCTDSYFSKTKVTLYQRESNAHKIRDLLEELEIPFTEKTRIRDIKEICGKVLKKPCQPATEFYIKKADVIGLDVCSNKYLPEWAKLLNEEQAAYFLDTLIEADGSIPTEATTSLVFYGQKAICDDVQIFCVTNGYSASLTEYREGQWRVNICKRAARKSENLVPNVYHYEGDVYCLETPNENFMIRSDNKAHFTGNCRLSRFIGQHPYLEGCFNLDRFVEDQGWEVHQFNVPLWINGVCFNHYMENPMSGRPVGGSMENKLNKFPHSFVHGHQQQYQYARRQHLQGTPHFGVCAGSFYLHDEDYRGANNTEHRGFVHLESFTNRYDKLDYDVKFVAIERLLAHY